MRPSGAGAAARAPPDRNRDRSWRGAGCRRRSAQADPGTSGIPAALRPRPSRAHRIHGRLLHGAARRRDAERGAGGRADRIAQTVSAGGGARRAPRGDALADRTRDPEDARTPRDDRAGSRPFGRGGRSHLGTRPSRRGTDRRDRGVDSGTPSEHERRAPYPRRAAIERGKAPRSQPARNRAPARRGCAASAWARRIGGAGARRACRSARAGKARSGRSRVGPAYGSCAVGECRGRDRRRGSSRCARRRRSKP